MAIPLARIVPRLLTRLRKGKNNNDNNPFQTIQEKEYDNNKNNNKNNPFQTIQEKQIQPSFDEFPNKPQKEFSEPKTKKMRVLGEINKRSKTFENIQRNTGIENKELDSILEDLEKNGLLKVVKKQGMAGIKIELHPTDKGVKEYYS